MTHSLPFLKDHWLKITRLEYDALLRSAREYSALRNALIIGGVPPENLEILINTPASEVREEAQLGKTHVKLVRKARWSAEADVFIPGSYDASRDESERCKGPPSAMRHSPKSQGCTPSSGQDVTGDYFETEEVENEDEEEHYYENNHEDRSLILKGISNFTTLADIIKVIRGGQVLNIFRRPRSAHVVFVDPMAAEKFLIYSKRADIYIRGKRIEVFWDDRQHFLPGHISRRIAFNGATRNLVIRFPKPDLTAESIREDLEHIHYLEVIGVSFEGGHAFISLNSIYQALIARSCMSSRFKYKGSRIEFYPDECNQPLPPIVKKTFQKIQSTLPITASFTNRFDMLAVTDGSQEE